MSDCPICHGAGWLRRDLPADDPAFGAPVLCECRRQDALDHELERILASSGLPRRGAGRLTFETFRMLSDDLVSVATALHAYAAEPSGWILLDGGYGSGKTHLLVATTQELARRRIPAYYQIVPELLDLLRASYRGAGEPVDDLWQRLLHVEVLLLDDLGAEQTTDWAAERLYTLINRRYLDELPLIVATNLDPERLAESRLGSRLLDRRLTTRLALSAPDYRLGGS